MPISQQTGIFCAIGYNAEKVDRLWSAFRYSKEYFTAGSAIFTSCIPKFVPSNKPRNACGMLSKAFNDRLFIFQLAILQPACKPLLKREEKSQTTYPCIRTLDLISVVSMRGLSQHPATPDERVF
jgi:hypothetical protein